jgi:hypothetical protein
MTKIFNLPYYRTFSKVYYDDYPNKMIKFAFVDSDDQNEDGQGDGNEMDGIEGIGKFKKFTYVGKMFFNEEAFKRAATNMNRDIALTLEDIGKLTKTQCSALYSVYKEQFEDFKEIYMKAFIDVSVSYN